LGLSSLGARANGNLDRRLWCVTDFITDLVIQVARIRGRHVNQRGPCLIVGNDHRSMVGSRVLNRVLRQSAFNDGDPAGLDLDLLLCERRSAGNEKHKDKHSHRNPFHAQKTRGHLEK
jgi:hypothetical protein